MFVISGSSAYIWETRTNTAFWNHSPVLIERCNVKFIVIAFLYGLLYAECVTGKVTNFQHLFS
jgi:hypothetical protein